MAAGGIEFWHELGVFWHELHVFPHELDVSGYHISSMRSKLQARYQIRVP